MRRLQGGAQITALTAAVVLMAGCGPRPRTVSHFTTTTTVPRTTTSPSTPGSSLSIESVAFFNGSDGYGLFNRTSGSSCSLAVAHTHDGGNTFAPLATVTDYTCANGYPARKVAFDNVGDGFVFGPTLFVSHDNGSTWNSQEG